MAGNPGKAFLWLSLPTVVVGVFAILLMMWRVPTRVQVEVVVDRLAFRLAGDGHQRVLQSLPFHSVMAKEVRQVVWYPDELEVADPAQYDGETDAFPDTAWDLVKLGEGELQFVSGADGLGMITFEPWRGRVSAAGSASSGLADQRDSGSQLGRMSPTGHIGAPLSTAGPVGVLDAVGGQPGTRLTLELPDEREQSLLLEVTAPDQSDGGQAPSGREQVQVVQLHRPFSGVVEGMTVQGVADFPYAGEEWIAFRGPRPTADATVELRAGRTLVLKVRTAATDSRPLFGRKNALPISQVEFVEQGGGGEPVTSLVAEGTLRYPEYPTLPAMTFEPPDMLVLEGLNRFVIQELAFDAPHRGLRVRLHGIAGTVATGSRDFPVDHRLSQFEKIWHHRQLWIIGAILVWVTGTTVGVYRFINEMVKTLKT